MCIHKDAGLGMYFGRDPLPIGARKRDPRDEASDRRHHCERNKREERCEFVSMDILYIYIEIGGWEYKGCWPLQDIAITNIVWHATQYRMVRGKQFIAQSCGQRRG